MYLSIKDYQRKLRITIRDLNNYLNILCIQYYYE